jgi:hypothetical protein
MLWFKEKKSTGTQVYTTAHQKGLAYRHLLHVLFRHGRAQHTGHVAPQPTQRVRALKHGAHWVVAVVLVGGAGLAAGALELPGLVAALAPALLPVRGVVRRQDHRHGNAAGCGICVFVVFVGLGGRRRRRGRGRGLQLLDTVDWVPTKKKANTSSALGFSDIFILIA